MRAAHALLEKREDFPLERIVNCPRCKSGLVGGRNAQSNHLFNFYRRPKEYGRRLNEKYAREVGSRFIRGRITRR